MAPLATKEKVGLVRLDACWMSSASFGRQKREKCFELETVDVCKQHERCVEVRQGERQASWTQSDQACLDACDVSSA